MNKSLDEKLLSAWLRLCNTVRNDRLVKGMSYNEMSVCNILHESGEGKVITASDIVSRTGILKSQLNKVLSGLEEKNYISRHVCSSDKRRIEIRLTQEGTWVYTKEHKNVLALVSRLKDKIGEDEAEKAIATLNMLAEAMQEV